MNRTLISIVAASIMILMLVDFRTESNVSHEPLPKVVEPNFILTGSVRPRETLEVIFNKLKLDKADLSGILTSSKGVHNLSMISVGSLYSFEVDKEEKKVQKMHLGIGDMSFLDVKRDSEGFISRKVTLQASPPPLLRGSRALGFAFPA